MLKSFIKNNLYFIIGCLVIVIIAVLISQMNYKIFEGADPTFTESDHNISPCDKNWKSIVPSDSGFYFISNDYNPIYVLSSAAKMDTLFQKGLLFNVDCSNILYSKSGKTKKYLCDNSVVLYESYSIGSFYESFKKLMNETNPSMYYTYDSRDVKNVFIEIIFNYDQGNDIKNTHSIKLNLNTSGKEVMDKEISSSVYIREPHSIYNSGIASGYTITLDKKDPRNVTYSVLIYKKDNTTDSLTGTPKLFERNTFLNLLNNKLNMNNHVVSIYDSRNTKYNLASPNISYIYGRINFAGNYCYTISQIKP